MMLLIIEDTSFLETLLEVFFLDLLLELFNILLFFNVLLLIVLFFLELFSIVLFLIVLFLTFANRSASSCSNSSVAPLARFIILLTKGGKRLDIVNIYFNNYRDKKTK